MQTSVAVVLIFALVVFAKVRQSGKKKTVTPNTIPSVVTTPGVDNTSPAIWSPEWKKEKRDKIWSWLKGRDWKMVLRWIGGLVLLNYAVHLSFPERWNEIYQSKWFWPVHAVVIAIIAFFTDQVFEKGEKVTKLHILAKLTLWVIVFGIGVNVWNWWDKRDNSPETAKSGQQTGSSPQAEALPLPAINPEGEKIVRETFLNAGFSADGAEEMVGISKRESGWNQFESDGKTPLRGRENPKDIGIFQDNIGWWNKELALYGTPEMNSWNINTLEGNLKIAVYLRKKYGLKPWDATSRTDFANAKLVIRVEAPIGAKFGKLERLVGRGSRYTLWYSGNVKVRVNRDDRRIYDDGPNLYAPIGEASEMEFLSRENVPVTVTIVFN